MEEPTEKDLQGAGPPQLADPGDQALEAAGDRDPYDFDVFISYATDPDYGLARQLESFLETFHRLPTLDTFPLSPLRVCVDGSDFKAARGEGEGSEVGPTIERYLAKSKTLLVLCSKNACRSPWVDKELRWFLTNRGRDAVIVAITEGDELNKLGEVFPQAIVEAGLHERIAYDFRGARRRSRQGLQALRDYEDERTRLAADLYGRPAGEIRPIWFREQRRQARNRTRVFAAVTAVLLGLLVATVYFFLNAREERKNALAEAARARQQSYVASVNFASRAINEGSVTLARQLLEAQRPGEGQEDLRDFDWWHLMRRAGPEKFRLLVKDVVLGTASVSSDGTLVAAAGESSLGRKDLYDESGPPQSVYVWSLSGGELRHVLKGHAGAVWAVKFSPKAPILVSAGNDGLKVWDAATGTETRSLKIPAVVSLAFSPDGRTVAAAHGPRFTLLDTTTWEKIGQLSASPNEFADALAFSPDGKLLATGGEDKKVHLWDVASRKEIKVLGGRARVLAVAWSARTNLLAVGGADGEVTLWDMNGQSEPARMTQGDGANALAFSPDGKLLAVGLGDPLDVESGKTVLLWDVATKTRRGLFKGHAGRVGALEFTPSGEAVVSAAEENAVRVWDVQSASFLTFFGGHDDLVGSLAFSPDGKLLASGDDGGTIRVWTLDSSAPPVTLKECDCPVVGLTFDPAGRLVWADIDGGLRLWEPVAGAVPKKLSAPELHWKAVQFAPDGNTLAATTCQGDIYLWAWPNFAPQWHTNQGNCLEFVAWSPDSRYFAVGGGHPEKPSPTSVSVWRVGDPKPLRVLEGHDSWPTGAAFSPDGKHLVTGSWDGEIIIWDFAAGVARHRMRGHTGRVTAVAYSPSGKVMASASNDESVRIWDVVTGQERMALLDSQQEMLTLAFHPDGKILAAAGSFYPVEKMQPPSGAQTVPAPTGMILIWAAANSAQAVVPQR